MPNEVKSMANQATNTQGNTNSRSTSKAAKSKEKQKQNKADITPQKLTLVNLAKESAQLDEFKEVSLLDGKYTVQVRQKLLPSKIQQLLLDVKEALLILKSENASLHDINRVFIILSMCIFKRFTDLPLSHLRTDKKRNISKLLEVADQLMDLGIFSELLAAFDPVEMDKLKETVGKMEDMGKDLGEIMVAATLNEQERMRKLGLEFVGDGVGDVGEGESVESNSIEENIENGY